MSSEPPKLGNTSIDVLTSLTKGVTGAIPIAGSLIAEIVGNIIPNQRLDRIARFLQLLNDRLERIELSLLESRLPRPEVVDLLEDAFMQAARATSQERLEHIAHVVANGISAKELNQAQTKRMLWLLGQLNDAEIVILRSKLTLTREDIDKDADFWSKHQELLAPDATHMGSSEDEFEEAALKRSYRAHLQDLGLVRARFKTPRRGEVPEFDGDTGMLKAGSTEITRLGRMLLRYLDLIPDWCRH